jgi:hypothetical protein
MLVRSLGDIAKVLRSADSKDKADIYSELGVRTPTNRTAAL